MHVDQNKTAKDDGRPEKLTLRAALRADHAYHVRNRPKDVNMTRVAHLVSKKRKIQEDGEHPALVNKPDRDVYHVRSRPKDVNMTRVANFVSKKRKIQEAGEHPALVNKPDGDAWTRPQIRSVIVAPPSWKKQKI
jgi:hypothetical protein